MKQKNLYALFLLVISQVVVAQTIDSVSIKKDSFFGRWHIAGISIGGGILESGGNENWLNYYNTLATNGNAKNKYAADMHRAESFSFKEIIEEYDYNTSLIAAIVFKPKKIASNKLISYTEFLAGVRISKQANNTTLYGVVDKSDTTFESYRTSYGYSTNSANINLLFTIQTPGFFTFFSLYSGVGAYGGLNFNTKISSAASYERTQSTNTVTEIDTTNLIFSEHTDFYNPTQSFGLYVPIGLKINISPRSNLFFEYIFNTHTQFFENDNQKKVAYKGVNFGYRYKFGAKKRVANGKDEFNKPAPPPEPLY